jgi:branched-chain amino acid transport system substrate-binding protein
MKKLLFIVFMVLLVSSLGVTGCSKSTTSQTGAVPAETLKIGLLFNFQDSSSYGALKCLDVSAELENANGGLEIGGKKYKIELDKIDSKGDSGIVKQAAEKMVFQDGVKFILGDMFIAPALAVTEPNKVVVVALDFSETVIKPEFHYSFNSGGAPNFTPTSFAWVNKKFPEKKTIVVAFPDSPPGHMTAPTVARAVKAANLNMLSDLWYPPTATDLSSIGQKIKDLKPDIYCDFGGPVLDALFIKAVYQSGYSVGQPFIPSTAPAAQLLGLAPAEALEGLIGAAWPIEADPPQDSMIKEFKDAYVKKYGSWDGPEVQTTSTYYLLRAALQQANSLDADKVASVIGNGMKYNSLCGPSIMVNRPDIGNNATVDSVSAAMIKQIKGGQMTVLDYISIEDSISAWNTYLNTK